MSLVTPDWLEKNLSNENIKVLDCSWHMPNTKRNGEDEFLKEHIPGSIFYLDEKQKTEAEESKRKMNETTFNY